MPSWPLITDSLAYELAAIWRYNCHSFE